MSYFPLLLELSGAPCLVAGGGALGAHKAGLLLDSGADVTVVYPAEGAVWLPAATAIVKGAPHLDAAKAFIDFQLSNEGQSIYANLTTRAVNSTLPLGNEFMKPFSEINVVYEDIPFCAEHKTEWQARYAEIRDRR